MPQPDPHTHADLGVCLGLVPFSHVHDLLLLDIKRKTERYEWLLERTETFEGVLDETLDHEIQAKVSNYGYNLIQFDGNDASLITM